MNDCNNCSFYDNALTDAGVTKAMRDEFNNRQNDLKMNDLDQMIIEETDKKEVRRLQVLQFLTNQNSGIIHGIGELKAAFQSDIIQHREKIDVIENDLLTHSNFVIKAKTSWYWLSIIFGFAQLCIGLGVTYISTSLDSVRAMNQDTRDYVHEKIPSNIDTIESMSRTIKEVKTEVEEQQSYLMELATRVDKISTDKTTRAGKQ